MRRQNKNGMRLCTKCGETKAEDQFRKDRKGRGGLSGRCKICRAATDAVWAKANVSRVRQNVARWQKLHPVQTAASKAKWVKAHPENAPLRKRRWRQAHPEKHAAWSAGRKARARNATPGWTNHVAVGEFYSFARIKSQMTGQKWNVDHIVPLNSPRVCGLHTHYNLQVISKKENISKGNRVWPDMPTEAA